MAIKVTESKIDDILVNLGRLSNYTIALDDDYNYWLVFKRSHSMMNISLEIWEDGTFRRKSSVKIAFTGEWEEDVVNGINKTIEKYELSRSN